MPNMRDLLVQLIEGVRGMGAGDPYDDTVERVSASDVVRWAIAEIDRHRMTPVEREVLEKVWPDYAANNDDAECAHIEATIHGYLVRTEQEQKTIRWIGKQGEDH